MIIINSIDPRHLWYVIGLITADGNLSLDGRHINITSKDIDLLENIKLALSVSNKITLKANGATKIKKYGFLQIGDKNFYKFLLSIGLEPKKSLTLKSLNVPRFFFPDFLRGVIDGDGSICTWINNKNKHTQWSLKICSGSYEFATWIKYTTEDIFKVKGKVYQYQTKFNPISTVKFGKLASKIILKNIYYTDCLALTRKLIKAEMCLETTNGLKNYNNVI